MTKSPLICNVRQPKVLRHLICVRRPNQTQSITQPQFNPFKKAIQEKEEGEMRLIQYLDAAFAGLAGDEDRAESRLLDGDGNLDAEPSSCSGCGATARRSARSSPLLAAPSIASSSSSSATAFLSSAGVVLLPREAQQAGDPSKEPHRIHPIVHPARREGDRDRSYHSIWFNELYRIQTRTPGSDSSWVLSSCVPRSFNGPFWVKIRTRRTESDSTPKFTCVHPHPSLIGSVHKDPIRNKHNSSSWNLIESLPTLRYINQY